MTTGLKDDTMPNREEHGGLLGDKHIIGAFVIGIGLVLVGFAMEEYLRGALTAIGSYFHPAAIIPKAVPPAAEQALTHHLDFIDLLVLLAKELGVAFLVAGIIGIVVEKQAKERDNLRAMQLRKDVASDAIFAIFGIRHRPEFVKAVVETNLEQRIMREDMSLKYALRTLREDEAHAILPHRHLEALERFVVLEMQSAYSFRNVSASEEEVNVRYAVALRQGAGARKLTRANYVRIGDHDLTEPEIKGGILDQSGDELVYSWNRRIPPNATLPVILNVLCIKERSDNEVWGSFFPSVGGVNLTLSVLDGMRFGVRPLSSANMVRQPTIPSETSRTWRLEGPLLKHNSAVFWWRTPEDDGEEDEKSPPVSFSAVELPTHLDDGAIERTWWDTIRSKVGGSLKPDT